MNNININNKNNGNFSVYRSSYIVAGVLLCIISMLSLVLFSLISFEVSGIILGMIRSFAYISALVCAMLLCVRCATANKLKNPDIYTPPRDTFYYFKRLAFIALMIVLINTAISVVGMVVVSILGGIFVRIESLYLREMMIKLPVFIVYLGFVYKMLVKFGFMDCEKKIYNFNFKILTFIISSIIMLPGAFYDSFFYTASFDASIFVNIQTFLSSNIGSYIIEQDGFRILNENFNIGNVILIALTIFITFTIQVAVFAFAYKRGREIFIKEHIRKLDEYETDENI